MNVTTFIFYAFCGVTLLSALFVLFTRQIIYSAFALLLTFVGVAAIYVFAAADFLAITQLLIYVGGILVLILFGVMFTNKLSGGTINSGHHYQLPALLTGAGVFALLLVTFQQANIGNLQAAQATLQQGSSVQPLGIALMTDYVLPLEIAGILLLVALIGTAFVAGKKLF